MNKVIIAIIIIAASASFSFADEGEQQPIPPKAEPKVQAAAQEAPKTVVKTVTLRTATPDTVTGKVDRVMAADLLTRPRSRIVIVDASDKSEEYIVKALAVIYDSTGRFLTLNDVKPGQEVQINYITKKDGPREAASIKILK